MATTRRQFLAVGTAGTVLLALGGTFIGLSPTTLRVPARPLVALEPVPFSVLAAFAEAVCPGGEGFPTAEEVEVAEQVDALLATTPPGMTAEVVQALLLVENALTGVIFDGRPRPFTACSLEERTAIVEGWRTSRLTLRRKVYKALRGLVASTYHADPRTYAAVGYPGPPDFSSLVAARVAAGEIRP